MAHGVRKWQKVVAPPSLANCEVHPQGLVHQVAFDEDAIGWVLVEEEGEPVGVTKNSPDGFEFVSAAELVVQSNPDLRLVDEFKTTGDKKNAPAKEKATAGAKK